MLGGYNWLLIEGRPLQLGATGHGGPELPCDDDTPGLNGEYADTVGPGGRIGDRTDRLWWVTRWAGSHRDPRGRRTDKSSAQRARYWLAGE